MEASITGDGKTRTPIDVSEVPGAIPPTVTVDDDPDVQKLADAMAATEGEPAAPSIAGNTADGPPLIEDSEPVDEEPPAVEESLEDDDRETPEPIDREDPQEILEPRILPIPRTLQDARDASQGGPRARTYTQRSLTWFGKIELYGLFGRAIDTAMQGENGLDVSDLMSAAQPKSLLEMFNTDLPGADTSPDAEGDEDKAQQLGMAAAGRVMATFARIASISPSLLQEAYCIILAIPQGHRKWAVDWAFPEMDDEMGEDILHAFIDQNWPVMEDFWRRRLPKMMRRAAKARQRHQSEQ